jgi:hypothetical protein
VLQVIPPLQSPLLQHASLAMQLPLQSFWLLLQAH